MKEIMKRADEVLVGMLLPTNFIGLTFDSSSDWLKYINMCGLEELEVLLGAYEDAEMYEECQYIFEKINDIKNG